MYFWWWTHKTISWKTSWYWHYYWHFLWRIFSCLCLTWGHLHKGGLDYRRMKTKRLTRLSVCVERKNVCKWSLAYFYLHVGKLLWSFFFAQFFSNILSSQYCFILGRWREKWTFGTILYMWRKKARKGRGIKGKTVWMQRFTQHVNITDWFLLPDLQLKRCCSQTSLKV